MFHELFETLDIGEDDLLSRNELHRAAKRLGWHWETAPIFAVLDLLTTTGPVSKNTFVDYMRQMDEDPLGISAKLFNLTDSPYYHMLSSNIMVEVKNDDRRLACVAILFSR